MMLSPVSSRSSLRTSKRPGAVFNTDPPPAGTTKPFVVTSCPPRRHCNCYSLQGRTQSTDGWFANHEVTPRALDARSRPANVGKSAYHLGYVPRCVTTPNWQTVLARSQQLREIDDGDQTKWRTAIWQR